MGSSGDYDSPLLSSQQPPLLPPQKAGAVGEDVNSTLEDTLNSRDTSLLRRLWLATWIEMTYLVPLAGPAIVVYLLNNVISMSTQIFCGHLGNLELAATSLGNNGVQLLAYGLMVCLSLYYLFYYYLGTV